MIPANKITSVPYMCLSGCGFAYAEILTRDVVIWLTTSTPVSPFCVCYVLVNLLPCLYSVAGGALLSGANYTWTVETLPAWYSL